MEHSIDEILAACDHTLLKPEAVWEEVRELCDDARKYKCASVCVSPCFVRPVRNYAGYDLKITTVIGFPSGCHSKTVKVYEAEHALREGADEIDMVINIGALKDKNYEYIKEEIKKIKAVCGRNILKVIVEACLLTEEEKIRMCDIVTESYADYIKTSTGFSTGGATFEDVKLFKEHIGPDVKIKAAGGIGSLEDADRFLTLGASRLGTSRIVKLVKEADKQVVQINN